MLTIIVYLKHHRPAIKTDIYADISRNNNMLQKLETLRDLGLVNIYQTVRYNSSYIVLTEKGMEVADMVEAMVKRVEEE